MSKVRTDPISIISAFQLQVEAAGWSGPSNNVYVNTYQSRTVGGNKIYWNLNDGTWGAGHEVGHGLGIKDTPGPQMMSTDQRGGLPTAENFLAILNGIGKGTSGDITYSYYDDDRGVVVVAVSGGALVTGPTFSDGMGNTYQSGLTYHDGSGAPFHIGTTGNAYPGPASEVRNPWGSGAGSMPSGMISGLGLAGAGMGTPGMGGSLGTYGGMFPPTEQHRQF